MRRYDQHDLSVVVLLRSCCGPAVVKVWGFLKGNTQNAVKWQYKGAYPLMKGTGSGSYHAYWTADVA